MFIYTFSYPSELSSPQGPNARHIKQLGSLFKNKQNQTKKKKVISVRYVLSLDILSDFNSIHKPFPAGTEVSTNFILFVQQKSISLYLIPCTMITSFQRLAIGHCLEFSCSFFIFQIFGCDYGLLLKGINSKCLSAERKISKHSIIGQIKQQWVTREFISSLNFAIVFDKLVE